MHKHHPAPCRDITLERPEPPAPADASAWECGDCGWTVEAQRLANGATLSEAIGQHGDKYCARPSPLPP